MNAIFEALQQLGADIGEVLNRFDGTRWVDLDGRTYQVTALPLDPEA